MVGSGWAKVCKPVSLKGPLIFLPYSIMYEYICVCVWVCVYNIYIISFCALRLTCCYALRYTTVKKSNPMTSLLTILDVFTALTLWHCLFKQFFYRKNSFNKLCHNIRAMQTLIVCMCKVITFNDINRNSHIANSFEHSVMLNLLQTIINM